MIQIVILGYIQNEPYFTRLIFQYVKITITIWLFNIAMENHHAINR